MGNGCLPDISLPAMTVLVIAHLINLQVLRFPRFLMLLL